MMISISIILTSCQTCPENQEVEIKRFDPGNFPELIDIDSFSAEEKRIVLDFMIDVYTEHLKLLLSAKTTGDFIDEIDNEIEYCRSVLDWIDSLKE